LFLGPESLNGVNGDDTIGVVTTGRSCTTCDGCSTNTHTTIAIATAVNDTNTVTNRSRVTSAQSPR
jgi:hypothetical protein